MKVLHVKAESNIDIIPVVRSSIKKLGKRVALVSTIQHLHTLKDVKLFLEKSGKKSVIKGQILGCSVPKINKKDFDSVLYIGSGEFHPLGILMKTAVDVIAANPLIGKVTKVTKKDIEKLEKRKKGAFVKFLSSENIGILLSTKPGQVFGSIRKIKGKYKDKNYYTFASETINLDEFENFPFIDCWINTACPRMQDDFFKTNKTLVNAEDLE